MPDNFIEHAVMTEQNGREIKEALLQINHTLQNTMPGDVHIYGLEMNHSTGVSRRLNEAFGKSFARHNGSYNAAIVNDFDKLYPWNKMRACKMSDDGTVLSYYGDPNYNTVVGDYMIEIPLFWYKDTVETVDGVEYRRMFLATNKVSGFKVHPIFLCENGDVNYFAYIGRMHASYANSIIGSRPDDAVKVSTSEVSFRSMCAAKGDGKWHLYDKAMQSAFDVLMHIEIGSFDEYSVVGNGVSSSDASIAVSSSIVDALIDPATGVCGSGWIGATNNKSNVCYRGVWDLWGNYWHWEDGFARVDGEYYYTDKPSLYSALTASATAASLEAAGWVNTHVGGYIASNGYQKTRVVFDNGHGGVSFPKTVGGASNTYYAAYLDDFGSGAPGLRAVLVGGGWNDGAYCSLVCEIGDDTPSGTFSSIGARLIRNNRG